MNNTNKILLAIAAVCVAALAFLVVKGYKAQGLLAQQNQELQEQLDLLTKEEKRSAVMQRVNAQLEEIANEENYPVLKYLLNDYRLTVLKADGSFENHSAEMFKANFRQLSSIVFSLSGSGSMLI